MGCSMSQMDHLNMYVAWSISLTVAYREAAVAWEAAFLKLAHRKLSRMAEKAGLRLAFSAERSVADELARESTADAATVAWSYAAMLVRPPWFRFNQTYVPFHTSPKPLLTDCVAYWSVLRLSITKYVLSSLQGSLGQAEIGCRGRLNIQSKQRRHLSLMRSTHVHETSLTGVSKVSDRCMWQWRSLWSLEDPK
jgi:hypothetical protein